MVVATATVIIIMQCISLSNRHIGLKLTQRYAIGLEDLKELSLPFDSYLDTFLLKKRIMSITSQ